MKKHIPLSLVIAIALVIVAAVGYMALVRPKRADVAKLDGEIATLQTQIAAATRLAGAAGKDKAVAIRVADLVKLAKAMPDEVDMAGIILQLNSAATAAGVQFSSIQPAAAEAGAGYTLIPINLGFRGTYYELTQLVFSLRNLVTVRDGVLGADGRLFTIDAVNLQEGPAEFPQIEATLTVSAYQYGLDPAVIAASGGAAPSAQTTTTGTTETTTAPTTTQAEIPSVRGGTATTGTTTQQTQTVPEPTTTAPPEQPSAEQQAEGVTP